MTSLREKKSLVVDHIDASTAGFSAQRKIALFRAFAATTSQPDLAALLFSWADEIEGVLQRNEQLRLNFQANNSSSPESEQDENDSSDGHDGHPKSEDVP